MTIEGRSGAAAGRRLRLGMVGGGRDAFIGAVHRMAARLDDRWEFVAGALSSDPARARASAADLGLDPARSYASWQEMAATEAERPDGIDAVAIVTPNHLHHPAARAFLERGIHVICDKPLTTTLEDALDLAATVERTGRVFVLTHNYTAYPMVRQARAMIEAGELGRVRVVQVEYAQDWLTTQLESSGHKQAAWRTDPSRSGPAGCLGDIGTHAYNLAGFVSGLACEELLADLTTFVPGRPLDDNVHILLRYQGGAKGMLWSSQVAPGNMNALRLRIYGEKAGLAWAQEEPDVLEFAPHGEPPRRIVRAGPGAGPAAGWGTRIPAGHPEGYLEGFAVIYRDAADLVRAAIEGGTPPAECALLPGVADGVAGVRFIAAAVASSAKGGVWVRPDAL